MNDSQDKIDPFITIMISGTYVGMSVILGFLLQGTEISESAEIGFSLFYLAFVNFLLSYVNRVQNTTNTDDDIFGKSWSGNLVFAVMLVIVGPAYLFIINTLNRVNMRAPGDESLQFNDFLQYSPPALLVLLASSYLMVKLSYWHVFHSDRLKYLSGKWYFGPFRWISKHLFPWMDKLIKVVLLFLFLWIFAYYNCVWVDELGISIPDKYCNGS